MGTQPPPKKGGRTPQVFGPFLLWPNGWMQQDGTWYGGRPQPRRLCVRWGPRTPPPKKGGRAPNFPPTSIVTKRLHGSRCHWYEGRPRPTRSPTLLDGDPAPPLLKGHSPQFSAKVRCGQKAGWTNMSLGVEASAQATLCSMGTQLPPEKMAHPPIFGPCLLWPNGWMDEDATWYGSRPRPRPHCIRRGDGCPSSPRKRHSSPPPSRYFRSMSIVATVAHLRSC